MSGNRYLLDTNAIIALLQGDSNLIQLLKNAKWIGISIISQLEFLAFSGLEEDDIKLFQQFLGEIEVCDLFSENEFLINHIISLRQRYRLKLPDAIITATANEKSATLVTRDARLITITDVKVVDW
ncbi:MAG: type II toxin-antitoxin system VapC family toxin [Cyanobacteria bacterium P01_A01_bin.40]